MIPFTLFLFLSFDTVFYYTFIDRKNVLLSLKVLREILLSAPSKQRRRWIIIWVIFDAIAETLGRDQSDPQAEWVILEPPSRIWLRHTLLTQLPKKLVCWFYLLYSNNFQLSLHCILCSIAVQLNIVRRVISLIHSWSLETLWPQSLQSFTDISNFWLHSF